MFKALLLVGAGSFIGGILRFSLGRFVQALSHTAFPLGTLVVNIAGSFAIGILLGLSLKGVLDSAEWKLFLVIGLCGGFTTFSSFSMENLELLRAGNISYFFLYAGLSVFAGLLVTFLGYASVRLF